MFSCFEFVECTSFTPLGSESHLKVASHSFQFDQQSIPFTKVERNIVLVGATYAACVIGRFLGYVRG